MSSLNLIDGMLIRAYRLANDCLVYFAVAISVSGVQDNSKITQIAQTMVLA